MPTPSEQKALAFVAIAVLLAGAVRVLRAGAILPPVPTAAEQQALARQTFAANSAATSQHGAKREKGRNRLRLTRNRRDDVSKDVGGVVSIPFTDVRPGVPLPASPAPPPGTPAAPRRPVDLDIATAAELEALPRIGPVLAKRILASRDSAGPFRSLEGLRRVKGIGPATIRLLAPLVTFSGQTRR